jgi:hypothetical protein
MSWNKGKVSRRRKIKVACETPFTHAWNFPAIFYVCHKSNHKKPKEIVKTFTLRNNIFSMSINRRKYSSHDESWQDVRPSRRFVETSQKNNLRFDEMLLKFSSPLLVNNALPTQVIIHGTHFFNPVTWTPYEMRPRKWIFSLACSSYFSIFLHPPLSNITDTYFHF